MIVVDTNVLAYLFIPGQQTEAVRRVMRRDPVWCAPPLWRSELRNVLFGYLRRGTMTVAEAIAIYAAAEKRLADGSLPVDPAHVLGLAVSSRCSGYDSEFVSVAQLANVPLVTADAKLIASFPQLAMSPEDFAPA